jgi:hypothetical protein
MRQGNKLIRHTWLAASLLIFLAAVAPVIMAADWISVSGYYKNFFVAIEPPEDAGESPLFDIKTLGSVSNRLRLDADLLPAGNVNFALSYDLVPRVQDPILFQSGSTLSGLRINPSGVYRAEDLDKRLYPPPGKDVESFAVMQNLDRANLAYHAPMGDIYAGRQAIAWGMARVINPTDIIAPFTYDELDTENRTGVDAVRVRIPIGFMGEFDAGYVFGGKFRYANSAWFVRTKFYQYRTDISLLAIGFQENFLAGLNLARSVGGAGTWLEAAYAFAGLLNSDNRSDEDYFRLSAGADYNFGDKTYGFFEYHFNGAGRADPGEYSSLADAIAYTEGAVYLLGEHYLAPGITYQITPLLIFSGQALWNMNDLSLLMVPNLEYNIQQNIYISAGGYIGIGKRLIFEPLNIPRIRYRSEFGAYGTTLYSSFRIYF